MAKPRITPHLTSDWVKTSEICQSLGCSRWHLETLREQEVLKRSEHWLNISPLAARPTYRYHEERCRAAIRALQELSVDPPSSSTPQMPSDAHQP